MKLCCITLYFNSLNIIKQNSFLLYVIAEINCLMLRKLTSSDILKNIMVTNPEEEVVGEEVRKVQTSVL
jgi:hypothetical protein